MFLSRNGLKSGAIRRSLDLWRNITVSESIQILAAAEVQGRPVKHPLRV
jgi:hypothetical protein